MMDKNALEIVQVCEIYKESTELLRAIYTVTN